MESNPDTIQPWKSVPDFRSRKCTNMVVCSPWEGNIIRTMIRGVILIFLSSPSPSVWVVSREGMRHSILTTSLTNHMCPSDTTDTGTRRKTPRTASKNVISKHMWMCILILYMCIILCIMWAHVMLNNCTHLTCTNVYHYSLVDSHFSLCRLSLSQQGITVYVNCYTYSCSTPATAATCIYERSY